MKKTTPLLLLLLALAGCSESVDTNALGASTQEMRELNGPVSVLDSGYWTRIMGCSGLCAMEYNFWVDMAVRNDSFDKEIGILWTADDWATTNTAYAIYEGSLEGGYERWGLDVNMGVFMQYNIPSEIEYAAFATMGGTTHWDENNNYYIVDAVSYEEPVRLLSSEVHMEENQVVLAGTVRVFDLGFEKQVTVRYTLDNWATWQDVPAEWTNDQEWRFHAEGLGATDALPEEVEFAVRYNVGGQEFWDNNGGANYDHQLAPTFQTGYTFADMSQAMSGILTMSGRFVSDLQTAGMHVRIDDGSWQEGSAITFSTEPMDDGAHHAEFQLALHGGETISHFVEFQVENTLDPVADWTPSATAGGDPLGTAWSATSANDDLYVLSSGAPFNVVLRYDDFGDDAPVQVFDAFPTTSNVWTISVDPDGRVYGVDNNRGRIFRLAADGHLDATFADAGQMSLSGEFDGRSICYPGDLEVDANGFYLLDTCNRRMLAFDHDGFLVDDVPMPTGSTYVPGALYRDGDDLWVVQYNRIHRIGLDDDGLGVDETIDLAFDLNNVGGLTRTRDGRFWASHGHAALSVFNIDGELEGRWWGSTGGESTLSGAFELPHVTETLPDGSVMVLGASGPQMVRFEEKHGNSGHGR